MPGNRVSSTASNRGGRRPLKSHHPSTQRPNMQSCAAAKRSRLQFVFELAQATFSQPGLPTAGQVEALRRTLSQVPLDELGLQDHLSEVASSSSSRSSSPGLHDGGLGAAAALGEAPPAPPRPPITYLLIYEDSRVSLGIFCLPARAKIPLHNHPGMTVLSRVLYGQMHISSYDWAAPEAGGPGGALPRPARLVLDATLSASDPPAVLFPRAGGNIHEFTALTDCAVLDLMSPPYSTEEGRDCTYYSVVPGPAAAAATAGGAPAEPSVLLDAYEPPLDFVINQGHYRGVQPRPKLLPYMLGGEGSPLAAVAAEAARAAAASTPPASLSPVRTPPISSPTSAATGGPKLSSLLGSGGAAPGDCALSAEPPQAGWHC